MSLVHFRNPEFDIRGHMPPIRISNLLAMNANAFRQDLRFSE